MWRQIASIICPRITLSRAEADNFQCNGFTVLYFGQYTLLNGCCLTFYRGIFYQVGFLSVFTTIYNNI